MGIFNNILCPNEHTYTCVLPQYTHTYTDIHTRACTVAGTTQNLSAIPSEIVQSETHHELRVDPTTAPSLTSIVSVLILSWSK